MEKTCPICGKSFKTKTSKKHCSKECSKAAKKINDKKRRQARKEARAATLNKTCATCGKAFVARQYNQKYCCQKCARTELRKSRQPFNYQIKEENATKPKRTLESMTPEELLNYGKISYQKQIEAMEKQNIVRTVRK